MGFINIKFDHNRHLFTASHRKIQIWFPQELVDSFRRKFNWQYYAGRDELMIEWYNELSASDRKQVIIEGYKPPRPMEDHGDFTPDAEYE